MSKNAWAYVTLIYLTGMVILVAALVSFDPSSAPWLAFGILAILGTVAQLFKSEAPTHQLYHPALIFFFAGVIVLAPFQFALLITIAHLIEWGKERYQRSAHLRAWYIQPFNICMHIIVGAGTQVVYRTINPAPDLATPLAITAALVAALFYSLLNHLIIGQVLVFARKISWKESEILKLENISIDFAMLVMGYLVAFFLRYGPMMIFPVLAPLYLIYKALTVPILKRQASTDAKTGLWNPVYFLQMLEAEIARSVRFERSLTVVVGDLDLLRNINNAYGHLAGDAVLIGVARILQESVRSYDVVSRFGGEEFAILMPETSPMDALDRVEDMRAKIEAAAFEDPISRRSIKATMSFGISGGVPIDQTCKQIIHAADVAVYNAKMKGRNCICLASEGQNSLEEENLMVS